VTGVALGADEVERYELSEPARWRFLSSRREFLALAGNGLAFACLLPKVALAGEQDPERRGADQEIAAWLHIGADGTATVYTGKVEVGQDVRTSLAQAVAEELRAPLASIRLVMGDTRVVPFDRGTFGSRSTPQMGAQLRRAAAAAREHLLRLAAERWGAGVEELVAVDGAVQGPARARLTYGELCAGQRFAAPVGDPELTPPEQWTVLGEPVAKVTAADMVTGRHAFTSDLRRDGMLHGKVLRPPHEGARLARCDVDAARALPGVIAVHDGEFAGVAALDELTATHALAALRPEWEEGERPAATSRALTDWLVEHPIEATDRGRGRGEAEVQGDVDAALRDATHRVEARYEIAYIAHAPLEPRAAVAEWSEDGKSLTVWTGTQRPFGVREELARAFRIDDGAVQVIVPDTGSGYGGKHTGEGAIEAARLARAAQRPVKLVWSREEEFRHAYFRPGGVIDVRAGATEGRIRAWEFHNWNSGAAAIECPYAPSADRRIEFHLARAPLRQGSYRGLAATANNFARESAIDELARACGAEPLAFRLANLEDERLRAVLAAAAERFAWEREMGPNRGYGIACGVEKGGRVATCAEIAFDPKERTVRVERLVVAFECGAVVNPDGLRNQIEGAAVMGLGGALFERVEFAGGEVHSDRFSRYRVPRFRDVPQIDVVLVDRRDLPSAGAGETPIIAIAPAIGNAIAAASGVRLHALPLLPEGRLG
jgi:isoquinoline 1-oxidoreductase